MEIEITYSGTIESNTKKFLFNCFHNSIKDGQGIDLEFRADDEDYNVVYTSVPFSSTPFNDTIDQFATEIRDYNSWRSDKGAHYLLSLVINGNFSEPANSTNANELPVQKVSLSFEGKKDFIN